MLCKQAHVEKFRREPNMLGHPACLYPEENDVKKCIRNITHIPSLSFGGRIHPVDLVKECVELIPDGVHHVDRLPLALLLEEMADIEGAHGNG